MVKELAQLETRLRNIVVQLVTSRDGSHDVAHFERVQRNAFTIADSEQGEIDHAVLLAAVWLHDIVQVEKNDPRRAEASRLAAERAAELLLTWDWPPDKIAAVRHAIEAHSFSAGIPPRTPEAKILRDADRLDSLGALGIARTFYVSGRLNKSLYDPIDPKAENRPFDDMSYALDHFPVKLLRLEESMLTATGKTIARHRSKVLQDFYEQFLREI